ncbi:MAG: hypothetical protein MI974_12805 [Chitinophagales bacterium]|nr:hypothetical protein [Chitinophagales bacterium]
MQNKQGGRTPAPNIPGELIQTIKEYKGFGHNPFTIQEPSTYSLAQQYQSIARTIHEKIYHYIKNHPQDEQAYQIIEAKLHKQGAEDFKKGIYPTEILDAKTLKRCIQSEKGSNSTQDILRLFKKIALQEKELLDHYRNIAGYYYQHVTHSTTHKVGKFQYSLYKFAIPGSQRGSFTRYIDDTHNLRDIPLKVEMADAKTMVVTNADRTSLLTFYIYVGDLKNTPPAFLQGVFLYRNRFGNMVANLVVFERCSQQPEEGEEEERFIKSFKAEREANEIPTSPNPVPVDNTNIPNLTVRKNIQYFLAQYAKPLKTLLFDNIFPFNFQKRTAFDTENLPNRPLFYNRTYRLTGFYHIYFPELFPWKENELFPKQNEDFSSVGVGKLQIYTGKSTGKLRCELYVKRNSSTTLKFRGSVVNNQLNSSSFIILSVYLKPDAHRYINMVLKVTSENMLTGSFNISYLQTGVFGSGLVIALRDKANHSNKDREEIMEADAIYAQKEHPDHPANIVNFLSHRKQSLVPVPDIKELEDHHDNPYEGIYMMHGKKGEDTCINGILVLHKNGSAIHEDTQGNRSFGECEMTTHTLDFIFRNTYSKRKWFCSARIDSVSPIAYQSRYLAITGGVSISQDHKPLSCHYVLEFIQKPHIFLSNLTAFFKAQKSIIPSEIQDFIRQYFPVTKETPLFFRKDDLVRLTAIKNSGAD